MSGFRPSFPNSVWECNSAKLCFASSHETEFPEACSQTEFRNKVNKGDRDSFFGLGITGNVSPLIAPGHLQPGRLARPVRVEHFLVVKAVVNRFQNSVYRQSIFFGDVIRGEWLQAD